MWGRDRRVRVRGIGVATLRMIDVCGGRVDGGLWGLGMS